MYYNKKKSFYGEIIKKYINKNNYIKKGDNLFLVKIIFLNIIYNLKWIYIIF